MPGMVKPDDFYDTCQSLLGAADSTPEFRYRVGKMMERILPIRRKPFYKTQKGGDMLELCIGKAGSLGEHLHSDEETLYLFLTELEGIYEDFLEKSYEFRVIIG